MSSAALYLHLHALRLSMLLVDNPERPGGYTGQKEAACAQGIHAGVDLAI